jgi:cellulose biosynthesis protein BcsQ
VGRAVRTIGFFNNKGGVGKTSLVYHVAWMFAELGARVVAADFDPQANLTSIFLDEDRLEAIWTEADRPTIYGAVSPQFRGIGDVRPPHVELIADRLGLLVGDLELSRFEDDLSQNWPKCADGDERAFRVTSALSRALNMAIEQHHADVALIDVGPNLGALNRSALLACDHIVVPLGADLFSIQGLRNMGPTLRDWRRLWSERLSRNPDAALPLPAGELRPLGYIVMRHSVLSGRPARAFGRWIARIPGEYRKSVLDELPGDQADPSEDGNCLARLKDYRSLMPLAHEARKPMFYLKPADGAFGGHQRAVFECFGDFQTLTREIARRAGVDLDL